MLEYDPSFTTVHIDDADGVDDGPEWDSPISPQTLVDQINEQGAAFGLAADFDEEMGRVFVCELVPRVEAHSGIGGDVDTAPTRRLCSVDDQHPFSAALGNRIDAVFAERPAERYSLLDEALAKEKQRRLDDHKAAFKSTMALRWRGGARYWHGMEGDLVQNRAARRARESARRAAERLRAQMRR